MQYVPVFAAALLVGIFLLDLLTPIGYAVWILYFLPILMASKTVKSRYFYLFPAISTLLTTLGLFLPFPSVDLKPIITRRMIGIFVIWAITFIIERRRKAERDLEKLSHELESRVEERTRELTRANSALHMEMTARKSSEEEVARLNADLAARAAELEDANRELEAFNYTVAHDLRNPLNIISGYCQVTTQICGGKLCDECRGYLQQAYDGTLRMDRLITALLDFSRMAHAEVHRESLEISAIAGAVAKELKQGEPERRVTFRISEGIVVDGDRDLLRVVLANLLGNAWKYTAARDEAEIEFGVTEIDGNVAYFVRDNGPGFDMADSSKLFTPFQRLAGAGEYRGFGIGLATVGRVIQRHGGKIWAEGEPGKGATFYFTLGQR